MFADERRLDALLTEIDAGIMRLEASPAAHQETIEVRALLRDILQALELLRDQRKSA